MPKKYIPIPKDQQKKRGPKSKDENSIETETILPVVNETPAPKQESMEVKPIVEEKKEEPAITPVEAVDDEPKPDSIQEEKKNSLVSSDVPGDLDSIINDYSSSGNNTQSDPVSSEDRIKAIHGETPAPTQTTAPKISLVRGYMILLVLDFVLPMGITFLLKKTKNPKFADIKPKDIKLSDDEFDDLEPVADEVAKDVQLNLSPMTQLFLGMSIIYGGKILTLDK